MTDEFRGVANSIAEETVEILEDQLSEYGDELLRVMRDDTITDKHSLALAAIRLQQLARAIEAYYQQIVKYATTGTTRDQANELNAEALKVYNRARESINAVGRKHFTEEELAMNHAPDSEPSEMKDISKLN